MEREHIQRSFNDATQEIDRMRRHMDACRFQYNRPDRDAEEVLNGFLASQILATTTGMRSLVHHKDCCDDLLLRCDQADILPMVDPVYVEATYRAVLLNQDAPVSEEDEGEVDRMIIRFPTGQSA